MATRGLVSGPQPPHLHSPPYPHSELQRFFDRHNERSGDWNVPGRWTHLDAREFKNLFRQHPQVKLCLSGHIHLGVGYQYNGSPYGYRTSA